MTKNVEELVIKNLTPNVGFLKIVPYPTRKKWHDALLACNVPQGHNAMVSLNENEQTCFCCLMVGHVAFGGDRTNMDRDTPNADSPFGIAFRMDSDPYIATHIISGESVPATNVNDDYKLTFKEIAKLICPEDYGYGIT